MRRAQIVLVILALLAGPVGLMQSLGDARPVGCPICGRMQAGASGTCTCPMHRKVQLPDFAFASPLAPTAPLPFFQLIVPPENRFALGDSQPVLSLGFTAPPFIPPRS